MTKSKQGNDMTNRIDVIYAKLELNYHYRFNKVQSITNTRQDNDLTNHKSVAYLKIGIEL